MNSQVVEVLPLDSSKPARNPSLEDAWALFAYYDHNANLAQTGFERQRFWTLALGVLITILAVGRSLLEGKAESLAWVQTLQLMPLTRYSIIILPIVVSVLSSGSIKFHQGPDWLALRNAAEAIKREIYRYRSQTEKYSPKQANGLDPAIQLAQQLKEINQRLMETQVNESALYSYQGDLPPYSAAGDDGFSSLSARDYLTWRLEDQLSYYRRKVQEMGQRRQQQQWLIYALGGIGTFLAAIGQEPLVAISAAIATALTSWVDSSQIEKRLTDYNRAASDLFDTRTWWRSLSVEEQQTTSNITALINQTEQILQTENSGWLQEMRQALAKITGDQSEEEADDPPAKSSLPARPLLTPQPTPRVLTDGSEPEPL